MANRPLLHYGPRKLSNSAKSLKIRAITPFKGLKVTDFGIKRKLIVYATMHISD